MLRWMMGIKRFEKIRAEEIRTTENIANVRKHKETGEKCTNWEKAEEDENRFWHKSLEISHVHIDVTVYFISMTRKRLRFNRKQ